MDPRKEITFQQFDSSITVRDPKFTFTTCPQPWHGHGYLISRFLDAQSILFPEGEQFFVESVLAVRNKVESSSNQISAFAAQEAIHRNYHLLYNRTLTEEGIYLSDRERGIRRLLSFLRNYTSEKDRLAVTVCFEHYTAIISRLSLTDPKLWESAEEQRMKLWKWHALEELEHRAVAFDVYRGIGGGYFRRVLWMIVLSLIYPALVGVNLVTLLHHDRVLFRPKTWLEGFWRLLVSPGALRRIIPNYLDFYKPWFHPSLLLGVEYSVSHVDPSGG